MSLLVEAVAIGQEKRDLMRSSKTSNSSHARQEVPAGDACSCLTTQVIVEILKGDVRLSKARSSDLFWEAVWPHLFARGWYSEQPRNYVLQTSKHLVLSKVASEPELLELESDEDKPVDPNTNQDSDDKRQHGYLQPHVPQCNQVLKFTIVDTSLVRSEDGIVKVTTLTSLPVFKPAYITEQGPDEQAVTESSLLIFGSPDHESSTFNNDLANHLDPKSCESKPDGTNENYGFQEKTPSGNGKYEEIIEEPCLENNRRGILIDLNVPQVAPGASMVQHVLVGQRHSKRNRPLTTKALEALAYGFLIPKKRKRGV